MTLVATGGRHKVNRADLSHRQRSSFMLLDKSQIKCFPSLLYFIQVKYGFFFVLSQFESISKIELIHQRNTMQEKKSRAVFRGRQSINAPSPVDVIIDTDLDVPLFVCVCVRACLGSPCVVNAAPPATQTSGARGGDAASGRFHVSCF